MAGIRNHPFAVEAYFKKSVVLTFAVPKQEIIPLVPHPLEPELWKHEWAFIAVAVVDTRNLRPKGFPIQLGNDFILCGYRVFVTYRDRRGRRLRGLFILKSQTNNRLMSFIGNIFTHYNYQTANIRITEKDFLTIESKSLKLKLNTNAHDASLPPGSPFLDIKEARRFAGPLPFTFTRLEKTKEIVIIEGVRQNWVPRPIIVLKYQVDFFTELKIEHATLANAFIVENIPYHWKKGLSEKWL